MAFGTHRLSRRAVLAAFFAAALGAASARAADPAIEALEQQGKAFASIAEKLDPAVVNITVEKTVTVGGSGSRLPELFRRFFGPGGPGRPQQDDEKEFRRRGMGSGIIFRKDGHILTNSHVVADAEVITVTLADGREFEAELVGSDSHTDIAVIKIDADDLSPATLGDSERMQVGEWVVAMGSPFGLTHTVTVGVVSATGRSAIGIVDYEDFIQTDAAINPGNSGGPLVNLKGKVIGINTVIYSRSGGYMGIGFAIPINMAKVISTQLIEHGTISRSYLGVIIQDLTPDLAEGLGMESTEGALVSKVSEGSPAAEAGVQTGDVILSFNDKRVEDVGSLRNRVSLTKPGTETTVTVRRDGEQKTLSVTLAKLESGQQTRTETPQQKTAETRLGMKVRNLTADLADRLGYEEGSGVVVSAVEAGSVTAQAGIRPGALVVRVGASPVRTVEEFRNAVSASLKKKGSVLLLVRQKGAQRFIVLRPQEQ
jgi:serine protease Do